MSTAAEVSPLRRRMVLWLALVVGLIAPAVAFSIAADAALPGHTDTGEFTKFEIDGDIAGANDWAGGGYGPYTTDQGRPSTGIVAITQEIDHCEEPGDDFYEGAIAGVPFPWPTDTGNVNRKNDICEFGTALEIVDVDGEYHYVVYGYAARPGNATGDQSLIFVLDKPGTQIGDVIVSYDFDPSGTSSFVTAEWDGVDWDLVPLSGTNVQAAQGPNPFVAGANPETFAEFAIDLTASGIFPPVDDAGVEQCTTFTSGGFATYTGNDANSSLADRAAPTSPTPVTNCSDLVVEKEGNVAGPGVNFLYEVNQLDGMTAHDDTLVPPSGKSDLIAGYNAFGTNIEVGESDLWQNVTAEPDYQIQEAVPPGWDLVGIECTWWNPFTNTQETELVTDESGILRQFQIPPTIVDNGVTTTCVMTNETSGLIVEKVGAGDPAADFEFDISGAPDTPYTLQLDTDTGLIAYDPGTTVTITETLPGSTPGWQYQGATCTSDGDTALDVSFGPDEAVEVDTIGGEVITCTFENVQDGQINVVKTGDPVGGGDSFGFDTNYADNSVAPDGTEDFSLEIDDPANNSGDLAPGDYTIVELLDAANVAADPDFVLGGIACEITASGSGASSFLYGGTDTFVAGDTDATVTLGAGDIVDCTFTNTQAGRLIVVKETDGADDTFAFDGSITGSITTTGGVTADGDELVIDLPPGGGYGVAETIPPGWELVDVQCTGEAGAFTPGDSGLLGIIIAPGETNTCTFFNERETAELTLTKDWGADVEAGDSVDLTATGNDAQTAGPATGDSTAPDTDNDAVLTVYPGETVTLAEAYDAGNVGAYEAASLVCDPADAGDLTYTAGDLSGTFVVPDDDPVDVTCTFLNERLTADLTLEKVWVNGFDGDTAEITAAGSNSDSTTSTAPDSASVTIEVLSGETIDLSEALGDDNTGSYTTELSCSDEDGLTYTSGELSGTYAVPASPSDVTCTFTNTRTSTTLTLDKNWVNPAAGDSVDLTITGEAGNGTGTVAGDGSTDDPATLTVYSGEVVSLEEAFNPGNPDWYSTSLTCSPVALGDGDYTPDALSGTLEITSTDAPITCTFLNTRETADVVVAKDVEPDTDSGLFDLSINGNVEVTDAGDGDASAPVEVFVGDPVTVSEDGGTDTDLANYTPTLDCDAGVTVDPNDGDSGAFDVPASAADATITCTFTNLRKSAELTVTKDWVNGADGDEVTLGAEGSSGNSAPAVGGSIAPDDDTDAVLTVWAGETVDIAELYDLANIGSYTADLACDTAGLDYTTGSLMGEFLVPSDPVATTCTFTNTRTSAELTLEKEWIDGADGDTADLDITNELGQDPADGATATADGTIGSYNDGTQVTAEVLSGEIVSLDEVLDAGNVGSYDSELSCDAAGLEPEPTVGTSGSYTMPKSPAAVTCTFTNTRTRVDLVLEKEWIDGAADDEALLEFTGDVASPSGTSTSTGVAGSEVDTPVATGEVLSGETVTISETLDPDNAATYASSLACDGGDPIGETSADYMVPTNATDDITCRFTNEAGRGNIVIVKNVEGADGTFDFTGDWPDPEDGDASPVGDFSIITDGGSGNQVWTGVLVPPDGAPYTVTELDPTPDYDGTNLVCVDPDGETTWDGLTASIDLDVGETVTCTYTNTQRSTITVIKDAVPDDDQAFTFTTSGDPLPDTFDLVDDGTDTNNSFTSELIPANESYSVLEEPVEGWDLTSVSCDNGDAPESITPAPGANVTCTFTNEAQPGRIIVTKTVEGVADTFAWSFDITIDPVDAGVTSPQTVSGTGNGSDEVTFEPLTLNQTYTIAEPVLPAGWEQTSFTCGVADEDAETPGYQITITEPDQTIDCEIVNTAIPSTVQVVKTVEGVADTFDWSFDFTIAPVPDGETSPKTASGTGDGTDSVEWTDLVPGQEYVIAEVTQDGFTTAGFECVDIEDTDDDPTTVTFIAPLGGGDGIDFGCAITNTAIPSEVDVTKTVEGIADGLDWSFDFTIAPVPDGQDATLTASGTGEGTATVGWTDLVPGETYTITETPVNGYDAGVLVCEGVDDLDGADDESVQFEAPLGGEGVEIDCAITNTARPSQVEVTKTVEGVADDYAWSFDFTIDPATDGEDATMTASGVGTSAETVMWENLVPGATYTITETSVAGFTPGEFACEGIEDADDDPLSVTFVAPLDVDAQDPEITCAITNTAEPGDVEVTKSVDGAMDDLAWSFDFTIDPAPAGQDATQTASGTGNGDAVVAWTDLVPGETYTIVEVDPGTSFVPGDLTCEVVRVDESTESVDPAAGITVEVGDSITCAITNTARGDVLIDKTVTSLDEPGDGTFTVTYDLVVSSNSVLDEPYTLDDELLFGDGITIDSSSVNSDDAAASASWDGIDDLVVTDGEQVLPVGETHTYTVVATGAVGPTSTAASRDCELAEGETGTGLLNEATVTYTTGSNSDDDCDEPENPAADLVVVKDGTEKIHLGVDETTAPVDYTMTVTNLGPGVAVDAVLTDTLPDNLDDVEVTTSVGTCDVDGLVITCMLGDLAPDATVELAVSAMINPFTEHTFTNVVEVTSSTPDPNPDNNRDDHTTVITKELPKTGADLGLLGLVAALLLMAGLAFREVGRVRTRTPRT